MSVLFLGPVFTLTFETAEQQQQGAIFWEVLFVRSAKTGIC